MIPKLGWPTTNHYITSHYGSRPTTKDTFHDGTDFRGGKGDPCFCTFDGVVVSKRWRNGYGLYLIIDHEDFQTAYAHLNAFNVDVGESVHCGQIVGYIGNTGTTDPHLHFEVRYGVYNPNTYFSKTGDKFNNSVDPMHYIDTSPSVEEIIAADTDSPEFWNRWVAAMRRTKETGSMTPDDFSTIVTGSKWTDDLIRDLHNHGN